VLIKERKPCSATVLDGPTNQVQLAALQAAPAQKSCHTPFTPGGGTAPTKQRPVAAGLATDAKSHQRSQRCVDVGQPGITPEPVAPMTSGLCISNCTAIVRHSATVDSNMGEMPLQDFCTTSWLQQHLMLNAHVQPGQHMLYASHQQQQQQQQQQ